MKWNKVEDRLPELNEWGESEELLVLEGGINPYIARLYDDDINEYEWRETISDNFLTIENVTHWAEIELPRSLLVRDYIAKRG